MDQNAFLGGTGSGRKKTMGSAMGAQKWMSLKQHATTTSCLEDLKKDGYTLIATDLSSNSVPMSEINWRSLGPCAIIMGNELDGISEEVREAVSQTFYIPMKGFAESLNVSVASAVLCSMMESRGILDDKIEGLERDLILLTWLARTVPSSLAILKAHGFEVGSKQLYESVCGFTTRP